MSGETMLVQAIAETLETMKKEDPMEALMTAKEALDMANDHNLYKKVLKVIAKLIRINASSGNYACRVDFTKLDSSLDSLDKQRLTMLLKDEGYKVNFLYENDIMVIYWGK